MTDAHKACRDSSHSSLNEYQHQAVHLVDGRYVLAATAGSGKTRVVVHRIQNLLSLGVPAPQIGTFTFSTDAAATIVNRGQMLGFPKDLRIGTLHSLCWDIVLNDGHKWAGENPRMEDKTIRYALKDMIGRQYRDRDLDPAVASMLIGLAKAACLSYHPLVGSAYEREILELFKDRADRPWLANAYASLYRDIEEFRYARGVVDFDDMLILAWLTLQDDAETAARWASKYRYLMVDEAQDSSRVQNAVVDILASRANNVMLIGDSQQTIYRWRGAEPDDFYGYAKRYQLFTLPVNYRSTKQICECATKLTAGRQWNVTGGTLAHPGAPDVPGSATAVQYEDPEAEAQAVVNEIVTLLQSGVQPNQIAVLYRVTWLLYPVEDMLLRARVPYVVWSGANFFERKEVRDLLAYLRVAALRDPDWSNAKRTIHAPFKYLGKAYVSEVEQFAMANQISFVEALSKYVAPRSSATQKGRDLFNLFAKLNKQMHEGLRADKVLQTVLDDTRYISFLKSDEGEDGPDPEGGRLAHVHQLMRVAGAFDNVPAFLDYIDQTVAALNAARGSRGYNAVVLSSIHRAKGLEWPYVFGIGWNDGVLPHPKNPDQDEELRLAYVCLTRAQHRFQASFTGRMVSASGTYEGKPSPYIARAELPVAWLPSTAARSAK